MIKKYIIRVLMVVCILWLSGCGKKEEDILHLGLNVKIVEIDSAEHIIYVSDMNENIEKVFGEICAIDCSKAIERENIIYVNYEDANDVPVAISFLQEGNDIVSANGTFMFGEELMNLTEETILQLFEGTYVTVQKVEK